MEDAAISLSVTLSGLELDNPLIPASGTFGYGLDYLDFFDINEVGSFAAKGTTLHPRNGNPQPRIAECAGGMLNAVGLQNPGVHAVIRDIFPALRNVYHKKLIANVGGFSTEEYAKIRFISTSMVAYSTPRKAEIKPITITISPCQNTSIPINWKAKRPKPYKATLSITPLIRADTWLGAAGWALGSHICSGIRPDFRAKPKKAHGLRRIASAIDTTKRAYWPKSQ